MLSLLVLGFSYTLHAAGPTVVYVHGFNLATKRPASQIACQKRSSCENYWPGASAAESRGAAKKVVFVGYDGRYNPTYFGHERGLTQLLSVLNQNCRYGGKYCRMVVHSMGGLITGYVMANYGHRYNITHVTSLVSAQGGSEIANIGHRLNRSVLTPLATAFDVSSAGVLKFLNAVRILTTSNSRARYDHNRTNGWFNPLKLDSLFLILLDISPHIFEVSPILKLNVASSYYKDG